MSDVRVTVVTPPPARQTVVTPPPAQQTVVHVGQGPAGPPGAGGGTGSDATYTHRQTTASAVWDVTHGLGKYPCVSVFDSSGDEVGGDVEFLSANALRLTFSAAFSGVAYLN